jgi:TRAP-type C4-dicarboxylate transport system substrate-binding protein
MFARTLIPIVIGAVAISGCGAGTSRDSRAGGQRPPKSTTLVLTTGLGVAEQPALDAFAADVAKRSGGTLKIKLRLSQFRGDPDAEQKVVGQVRDGDVALGMVGARVLDTEGVKSFQALLAPGLVTSVELEDEVIGGDIGKQMLSGVERAGVTGVGLFDGALRRLLGVTRDFRAPSDFAGARIGLQKSDEAAATFRALGAKPVALPAGADLSGIDGYEQQLESAAGNGYARSLNSISPLVLWPRPLVIVGNPDTLAKLTDRQREALTAAAAAGRAVSVTQVNDNERAAVEQLCRSGVPFVRFPAQSLTAATRPVYAQLEGDAATKRFLAQIRALDAASDPMPHCTATEGKHGREASALDGNYHMTVSKAQQTRIDGGTPTPENWGDWRLVIDRGRFLWTQNNPDACTWGYGTAVLKGTQMTWEFEDGGGIAPMNANNKAGERFVWKPKLYHDTLALTNVEPAPEAFGTVRWTRTSDTPSSDVFFKRCEPPAEAQVG